MHGTRAPPTTERGPDPRDVRGRARHDHPLVGLVIDGGNVFFNRRDSQNAPDIAAARRHEASVRLLRQQHRVHRLEQRLHGDPDRLDQNKCSVAAFDLHVDRALCRRRRTAPSFPDLGLAAVDRHGAARRGQRPEGARRQGRRHQDPADVPPGRHGRRRPGMSTRPRPRHRSAAAAPPRASSCRSRWSMPATINEGSIYALTSGSNGPGNFGWVRGTAATAPAHSRPACARPTTRPSPCPYRVPGRPGQDQRSSVRACLQQWVDNQQTVLIPIVYAPNDPANAGRLQHRRQRQQLHVLHHEVVSFTLTGYAQPAVDQINGRFDRRSPTRRARRSRPAGRCRPPWTARTTSAWRSSAGATGQALGCRGRPTDAAFHARHLAAGDPLSCVAG